jgi:riboflavin biosynthesis pyrimidine reductase
MMRMILPEADGPAAGRKLDDLGLAEAYAYPRERWLRANMVMSADGSATVAGKSGGLSSAGDKRIFGILRALADVVLAGAGTVRTEEYKPARPRPALAALRAGRPATATIAVISRSLDLDLTAPLFTEAPPDARTIVITCGAAPAGLRAATAKVADVIVAGQESVDLAAALAALADRGLGRVICEGGPHLLGQIAAAGLLDELSLTISPTLAGPGAGRIIAGDAFPARTMTLTQVLAEDAYLFCRYHIMKNPGSPGPAGTV